MNPQASTRPRDRGNLNERQCCSRAPPATRPAPGPISIRRFGCLAGSTSCPASGSFLDWKGLRPGGGVKTADDGDLLDGLDAAFSPERMGTYLQAAQGDREQALRLYTWNTAISAAFYGPLQALEIALRNAMHRELTVCYGEEWYDNPAAGLDRWARERIADARLTAQRTGHTATPSRVVATLAFGFWVALLSTGGRIERAGPKADYEKTLWRPALRGAFPPPRDPDAPTGPQAAGRAARAAEPLRAPRACLREALARGPRPHPRGDRLDLASRAGVDRAAQPRVEAARRCGRRDRSTAVRKSRPGASSRVGSGPIGSKRHGSAVTRPIRRLVLACGRRARPLPSRRRPGAGDRARRRRRGLAPGT